MPGCRRFIIFIHVVNVGFGIRTKGALVGHMPKSQPGGLAKELGPKGLILFSINEKHLSTLVGTDTKSIEEDFDTESH